MLAAIRRFFVDLGSDEKRDAFGEEDFRLAAAALLYHVIAVDGMVTEDERVMLADLLMRRFGIDITQAEALVEAAETADNEAVDLYGFTSVLKRRLDEAGREKIVELMWKLVYVDGQVNEFEDNVIWRVAELLGVSPEARMRLKRTVREHLQR